MAAGAAACGQSRGPAGGADAPTAGGEEGGLAGRVFVRQGDAGPGLGSFHFLGEVDAYISYESEQCDKLYPRLDRRSGGNAPGERMPRRMPFRGASYDRERRVFRGAVSFSRDMGDYEEIQTVGGVEREEYELVFAPDFASISGGSCKSFAPNASRPQRVDTFGVDVLYSRLVDEPVVSEGAVAAPPAARSLVPAAGAPAAGAPAGAPAAAPAAVAPRQRLAAAVLARDAVALRCALEALGPTVGEALRAGLLDATDVWQLMRWDPGAAWRDPPPPALPAPAAAALLAWPAGVELCVRAGADVNAALRSPLPAAAGGAAPPPPEGHPLLRVALSVRGPQQCLISRHVLDGRVDYKVFQRVRKKCDAEMEVDTRAMLGSWLGPFRQTGG